MPEKEESKLEAVMSVIAVASPVISALARIFTAIADFEAGGVTEEEIKAELATVKIDLVDKFAKMRAELDALT